MFCFLSSFTRKYWLWIYLDLFWPVLTGICECILTGKPVCTNSFVNVKNGSAEVTVQLHSFPFISTIKWYKSTEQIRSDPKKYQTTNLSYVTMTISYGVQVQMEGYTLQLIISGIGRDDFDDYGAKVANDLGEVMCKAEFRIPGMFLYLFLLNRINMYYIYKCFVNKWYACKDISYYHYVTIESRKTHHCFSLFMFFNVCLITWDLRLSMVFQQSVQLVILNRLRAKLYNFQRLKNTDYSVLWRVSTNNFLSTSNERIL